MKNIPFGSIGGRKWLTGIACLTLEVVLICSHLISELAFKEMFLVTLGITVGGNVAQKIWAKSKGD